MRRFAALAAAVMLAVALAVPAMAANSIKNIQSRSIVAADGSCQVEMNVTFRLDYAVDDPTFPVPGNARDVQVQGANVRTRRSGDVLQADLSRFVGGVAGEYTLNIRYSVSELLSFNEKEQLELHLPLLSGFQYPVQAMDFTINLPQPLDAATDPVSFYSGYHQESIQSSLTFSIEGNVVSGQLTQELKDHETLTMLLAAPEGMFPQAQVKEWSISFDDIAMYVLTGIAFVYWLVFLRCAPARRIHSASSPEGFSAGELGSVLIAEGADLTMMVLSWAQLGYVLIHLDQRDRVVLHKRMEMGNEQSAFQRRVFQMLFGKRRMVEGNSLFYAKLCRRVASMKPELRSFYRKDSGNVTVFRLLCAAVSLFGGASLGMALAGQAWLAVVLVILFSVLGAVSSLLIQGFTKGLHLRHRERLWLGLGLSLFWLALGLLAGEMIVALWMVFTQLLGGLAASYGGRRTALGRQTMGRILGLRKYLRSGSKADRQRILRSQPEYYFSMAPTAVALGVDGAFAKSFGGKRLVSCPYLTTGMDAHMSAAEWNGLLRQTVKLLDERQKQLYLEQLLRK